MKFIEIWIFSTSASSYNLYSGRKNSFASRYIFLPGVKPIKSKPDGIQNGKGPPGGNANGGGLPGSNSNGEKFKMPYTTGMS